MAYQEAPSWIDYEDPGDAWERPNVIFLMVDDIGQHDLGCYGGEWIPTPNLDRLAGEGTRFTDCYAGTAVCAPSRSVLMTGQHAGHTRVRGNHATVGGAWVDDEDWHGGGRHTVPLQGTDTTIAEVMSAAGYATGAVGKWGLGDLGTEGMPTRQGFDSFYGYLDQVHAHDYYTDFLVRNEEREPIEENRSVGNDAIGAPEYRGGERSEGIHTHEVFIEESLEYVREHADEDFFLYLPWTVPHAPYLVPEFADFVEEEWSDMEKGYASMVAWIDRSVGRLLDCLQAEGIDEETIVFFCSDHGPAEQNCGEPFESTGPLRGYKRDLYEGGIRTPMLVRWPGHVPAGRVDDSSWYYPDVLPTMAELAGYEASLGGLDVETDGHSVLRTLLGDSQPLYRRYLYWEFPKQGETGTGLAQAARFDDWKAVRGTQDAPTELYDLSTDIGERDDLSDERPEVVGRFERYFEQAHEESRHWPSW